MKISQTFTFEYETVNPDSPIVCYPGLTEEQTKRIDWIREAMASLNREAVSIVKPLSQEIDEGIEMYADNGAYDLAETMMDSWGAWDDILQGRQCAAEDLEELNRCSVCGEAECLKDHAAE